MVEAHEDRHAAVQATGAVLCAIAEVFETLVREVAIRAASLLEADQVRTLPAQHFGDAGHPCADAVHVPADDPEPLGVCRHFPAPLMSLRGKRLLHKSGNCSLHKTGDYALHNCQLRGGARKRLGAGCTNRGMPAWTPW